MIGDSVTSFPTKSGVIHVKGESTGTLQNRRLPPGEKGSLKYFTAHIDGVLTRLAGIISQNV